MELPYTHKLRVPIQHGNESITELVFKRRPVADDLRDIRLTQLDLGENIIKLTGRLTNFPPSAIKKLDFADTYDLGEVLTGFLPDGPKTGSEPADS